MHATPISFGLLPRLLILAMACGLTASIARAQSFRESQTGWDQAAAARYLDDRMDLWFEKARQLPTGEGRVTCISCHAVVPYLLARPTLRKAMRITEPASQEARLLDNIMRRVETCSNRASMSDAKHGGEHGTEEVLNALILARHDADERKPQASEITRKAFRQLWETQRSDGAWDWMDFAQEPDESAAGRFYGAALAGVAVGTVPALWGGSGGYPTASEGRLRGYLRENYSRQNLYNRVWMFLASARWPGLLTQPECDELIAELKLKQHRDGGWSLWGLGPWRWSRTNPPFAPPGKPDVALLEKSDGYATGLIVYTLRETGFPANDPVLTRAIAWLKANQKEVRVEGRSWKCWRAYSLNHDREKGGSTGGEWRQMLMSDMATALAVLALCATD
ncbi:MAG TPA: hypothetical protein VJA21_03680 [Verrucomicrobiae bacterium]